MQNSKTLTTSISTNIILEFLLVILMYLYIFQPPLISKYIFLGVEIAIFIVFQCYWNFRPLYEFYNCFKTEINVLFIIVLYAVIRDLIGGEVVYSSRMSYFSFQAFFFSSFIIWLLREKNIKRLLLYAGILGSCITIAMMVNSSINSLLTNYMKDELVNYENFEIRYRGYGFSENITFSYSYVLGICGSICLLKIKRRLRYSVPFLTCLIGVAFNARVGFIPIIVTILYLVFIKNEFKTIIKILVGVIFLIFCANVFAKEQINLYTETSGAWILSFFYELSDFLFGTSLQSDNSTFNNLAGSFIIFPDGLNEWIFGSGKSLFLDNTGHNSDIGYILQLNYGGMIFLLLICFFIVYTAARYWELNKMSWFAIIYTVSVLILNYKGFFFAGTPGARFLYLLYTLGILNKLKGKFNYK